MNYKFVKYTFNDLAPSSTLEINPTGINRHLVDSNPIVIGIDTTDGAVLVNLNHSFRQGTTFIIKDISGTTEVNNITISAQIDGTGTWYIREPYGSIRIVNNGDGTNFVMV